MTLNFVIGTAAELIKLHPVLALAEKRGHNVRVLATGQSHQNLNTQLKDFSMDLDAVRWLVPPEGDLQKSSQALKWFLRAIWGTRSSEGLLPGPVVVHGDTLSTLVGARLARKHSRLLVHVEAGLRSSRWFNPFPEELTRRLVSRLARAHMAPDETACENLRRARVRGDVLNTGGNTLIDAVREFSQESRPISERPFVVVNIHRFENLNSPVRWQVIVRTLLRAARSHKLVFVSHPLTRYKLENDREALVQLTAAGLEFHDRMPFRKFLNRLHGADYVISDGGSNQEECSYLGKPCLLLRESTERKEGLDGSCLLTRFDESLIAKFLDHPEQYARRPLAAETSPSLRIMEYLEAHA